MKHTEFPWIIIPSFILAALCFFFALVGSLKPDVATMYKEIQVERPPYPPYVGTEAQYGAVSFENDKDGNPIWIECEIQKEQ